MVFSDVTQASGIDVLHESGLSKEKLIVETVGSGLAWIDYDNDGYLDLYFVNGSRMSEEKPSPGNALIRNGGRGTFENVTRKAGIAGNGSCGMGVAVGDYDNDGRMDLYVVNYLDYDPEDNPYYGLPKEGYRLYCDIRMFEGAADQLYRNSC